MNTIGASGAAQAISPVVISGVVIVFAIVFVALRFYVRIFTKAGLGWDDWLLCAAATSTILAVVLLLCANYINRHLSSSQSTEYNALPVKITFAAWVLYYTITGSTKMSILLMYNRIFAVNASFKRQLYLASFIVLGWWVGCTIATLTNCIPLKYT